MRPLALLKLSFYIIKGKSQYDEDKVGIVWNLYKIKNYGRYFGIFLYQVLSTSSL